VKFIDTKFPGAYLINLDKIEDDRGFFSRMWCRNEFRKVGIDQSFVQANIGYSAKEGTLRGCHYQTAPYEESKLVRCIAGEIFDVIIDVRADSPTYTEWQSFYLKSTEYNSLFIPKGFAHGYLTLKDNTEIFYLVSQYYTPEAEKGIRWNDPVIGIQWPVDSPRVISEKDRNLEDFIP
jgi:dTDP-4-dehydrorhamnose 3,5-epimerase